MKGKYKNLQGETIDILQHDEANKIVYIRTVEGETKWISTEDSKWWQPLDAPIVEEIVVKIPAPVVEVPVIEEVKEEVNPVEVVVPKEEPKLVIEQPKATAPKHEIHKQKGKKK